MGVGAGFRGWPQPDTRRTAAAWLPKLGWIFLFVALALCFGVRNLHFDTLERAWLVEHPARYLHSWDGTPRSQFLFYAHMLELPLAYVLGGVFLGVPGLHALLFFEALCGAVVVLALGRIVRRWGGDRIAVWSIQATLAACLAFWKMASGGEEKVAALATQLLFLIAFWEALSTGRRVGFVGAALALAVLVHLSGAVLVPFAFLALFSLPPEWKRSRRRVGLSLATGAAVAGIVFVVVAALTNDVRNLDDLVAYAGFYHTPGGNDFFELTGAGHPEGSRLRRMLMGLADFFAHGRWGFVVLGVVVPAVAAAVAASIGRRVARPFLLQAAILGALWTAHFAFFQPHDYESWTLWVALALAVLGGAIVPGSRARWALAMLPVALLCVNLPTMVRLHRPIPLEASRRAIETSSRPGDVVLLLGGRSGGKPLKGSYWIRYYLAKLRDRQIVSLYDVFGVGDGDYWGKPLTRAADVQNAIESGKRVFTPDFMAAEYDTIAALARLDIQLRPVGGALEVVSFRRVPPGGGTQHAPPRSRID